MVVRPNATHPLFVDIGYIPRYDVEDNTAEWNYMIKKMLSSFTLLLPLVAADFLLTYPPTLGFNDGTEDLAPCGGFPVVFNNVTTPSINISVGGFAIELFSSQPQSSFLFRATIDAQEPFTWTDLVPVVEETGRGDFCLPRLSVPDAFAGHAGVIQIVQSAETTIYQVGASTL